MLSAGALPLLGATILLTFSWGAIVAGAVGVVALVLAGRTRALLGGLIATAPATAIAVVAAYRADLLGTDEYTTSAAVAQGQDAALVIGLAIVGAVALRGSWCPWIEGSCCGPGAG